ncbi:head GIN domain-containing protein [Fluviicola sp.]|uniref:head GIN domain-containing protein n=1 Tax=Fluviicola sp. TaxID=1917219 RepID=UPI0031D87497
MKSLRWIIPGILLLAVPFSSCKKQVFNSIKGKGQTVTEIRDLSGFNKISLDIDAHVFYTQDSVYYVEISAQQNVLDVITTEISSGELEIDSRKWIRKHNGINIIVHSPDLYALDISGSGNIESAAGISTSTLELNVSGSGNITLSSIHSAELEAKISGSGNISASGGTATNQKSTISGSGNIDMQNLTANHSDAKISGSGNISVWASNQLKATISGSGDIRYRGNPVVNTTISGSGSVIHI